jgi:aspartokinase-like uncharacterized kinase
MKVVKLGGSLYNSPEQLRQWLKTLEQASQDDSIVIVPGGGPFADQVRNAQRLHDLNDQSAHHMAILAMAQFGLLLADIEPQCQTFYYPEDTFAPENRLYLWLPDRALLDVAELPHSWDISSDSLALWLSQKLRATALFVIKSTQRLSDNIETLLQDGVVDKGFRTLYQQSPIPTQLFHIEQQSLFPDKGMLIK